MKRRVESRPRGPLALREARLDLVKSEGVVPECVGVLLDVRAAGLGRLLVPVDRSALAEARDAVVADLHLNDLGRVGGVAGDHERLGQVQRGEAGGDLHPPTLTRSRY